jgi:hypothetical protein
MIAVDSTVRILAYAAIVTKQIASTCNDFVAASIYIATRALCKTLQTTSLPSYNEVYKMLQQAVCMLYAGESD